MKLLSPHFSLEELTFSQTAVGHGINNSPSDLVIKHLTTLSKSLEKVREILGHPLHINSGYRCLALNELVHSFPNSAHILGFAADFVCFPFGSPIEIVREILKHPEIMFDQIIEEGTWVHFSVDPRMRQEVLTAHFVDGVAHYQKGLRS